MSRARRRSWCWQKSSWAKYLHRRKPLGRGADGHVWRSEAVTCGIPYRAAAAKRLRYEPVIYARYGGESGGLRALAVLDPRPRNGRACPADARDIGERKRLRPSDSYAGHDYL